MIVTEFRTEDLPASERFGAFHDMTADALISTAISSDHQDDFRVRWGFGHPAVFSRAFRSVYGLSPRDYRQHVLMWAKALSVKGSDASGQ